MPPASVHTALHSFHPLTVSPPSAASSPYPSSADFAYPPFAAHSRASSYSSSAASTPTHSSPYLASLAWADRASSQSSQPGHVTAASVVWPPHAHAAASSAASVHSAHSVDSIDSLSSCRLSSSPALHPASPHPQQLAHSFSLSVSSPGGGFLAHSAQQSHMQPTAAGLMNLVSPSSATKRKQQEAATASLPKTSPPLPATAAAALAAVSASMLASASASHADGDGLGKKARTSAAASLHASPFAVPLSRPPARQSSPAPLMLEVPSLSRSVSSPTAPTRQLSFHSPTAASNGKRRKQHKRLASGSYYPAPVEDAADDASSSASVAIHPYSPPPPTTAPASPTPSNIASSHSSSSASSVSSAHSSPRHTRSTAQLATATTTTTVASTSTTVASVGSVDPALHGNTYLAAGQLEVFERVNEVMKRDHIRQRSIARMMCISCSTLSPMLKGKYKHTKLKHVEALRNWCYQRDVRLWRKVAYYADCAQMNEESLARHCGMNAAYFKQWLTFTLPLKYRAPFDHTLQEWVHSLGSDVPQYVERADDLGTANRAHEQSGGAQKAKAKPKKSPKSKAAVKTEPADDTKDGGENKEDQPAKAGRAKKERCAVKREAKAGRVRVKVEAKSEAEEEEEAEAEAEEGEEGFDEEELLPPVDDFEFAVSADSTLARFGLPAPLLPPTMSEEMGEKSALQLVPFELARLQALYEARAVEAALAVSAEARSVAQYAKLPADASEQERLFRTQQQLIASQQQQLDIFTRMYAAKGNPSVAAVFAQQQQQEQQQRAQQQLAMQRQHAAMMEERSGLTSLHSAPLAHSPTSSASSHSSWLTQRRSPTAVAAAAPEQSVAEQVEAMFGQDAFTDENEAMLKEMQDSERHAVRQSQRQQQAHPEGPLSPIRAGVAAGVFFTPDRHAAALHSFASSSGSSQPPPLTPASDASSAYSSAATTPVSRRHLTVAQPVAFLFVARGGGPQTGKQSVVYDVEQSQPQHDRSGSLDLSASFASALGQHHWSDDSMSMLVSPSLSSSAPSHQSLSPMPGGQHHSGSESSAGSFLLSKLPSASTSPEHSLGARVASMGASHPGDMHEDDLFGDAWQHAPHAQHSAQQQQQQQQQQQYAQQLQYAVQQQQRRLDDADEYDSVDEEMRLAAEAAADSQAARYALDHNNNRRQMY